jgi:SAM-dependent methyltransferase
MCINILVIEMKVDWGNFESNLIFLNKLKLLSNKQNIPEIGSGTGHLIKYLRDLGYNITGTEANDKFIQYAKESYCIDLIKETTANLNFKDCSFDVVMSFDVIEHMPRVNEHIKEIKRILKGRGVYILSTPNKWTNIPFEIMTKKSFTKYKKYHCSLQNYWELKKLFEHHDFDIEFIDVPIVNDFFLKKIYKHFGIIGENMVKFIPIDKLPIFLRTNFYMVAIKR